MARNTKDALPEGFGELYGLLQMAADALLPQGRNGRSDSEVLRMALEAVPRWMDRLRACDRQIEEQSKTIDGLQRRVDDERRRTGEKQMELEALANQFRLAEQRIDELLGIAANQARALAEK